MIAGGSTGSTNKRKAGIPWHTIAAAIERTPENEVAERAVKRLHAKDAVDISSRSEGVKK